MTQIFYRTFFYFCIYLLSTYSFSYSHESNVGCSKYFKIYEIENWGALAEHEKVRFRDKIFLTEETNYVPYINYDTYFLEEIKSKGELLVNKYTSDGYTELNKFLSVKPNFIAPKVVYKTEFLIKEFLKKQTPYEGTLYSGAAVSDATFLKWNYQVGAVIKFPYFISSSKRLNVAHYFANRPVSHSPGNTVRVIFYLDSKSAVDISRFSHFENEAEFLFSPETPFLINEILVPKSFKFKMHEGFDYYKKIKYSDDEFVKIYLKELNQNGDVDLKDLSFEYLSFQIRDIDQKRFIGEKSAPDIKYHLSQDQSLKDWNDALEFILHLDERSLVNADLLKQIHKIATKNHYFRGFESRQILSDFKKNKMRFNEAMDLLQQNRELEKYSIVDHNLLRGEYRKENFTDYGLRENEHGEKYFTENELSLIARNPHFFIQSYSENPFHPGMFKAKVSYVNAKEINYLVEKAFRDFNQANVKSLSTQEYLRLVLKLQQTLISIHPFTDGNGRATKLLSDFLYKKRKLPPPLYPITDDYFFSIDDLYVKTAQNMLLYKQLKR